MTNLGLERHDIILLDNWDWNNHNGIGADTAMTGAFLKNDMKGAFGHRDEKEEYGQYSVDFREVIVPDDYRREHGREEVCQLKIDFHGNGAPKGGAQMFIKLDQYDVEQLLPAINDAYKKMMEWKAAHPPTKECEACKGTGCRDGNTEAITIERCEVCKGEGKVPA